MPPCRGVFDGIPLAQAGPEAGSRSLRKEARPPASPLRSLFCVWRLKSFRPAPLALRPVARGEAPLDPPAAGFRGGSPRYAAGGVRAEPQRTPSSESVGCWATLRKVSLSFVPCCCRKRSGGSAKACSRRSLIQTVAVAEVRGAPRSVPRRGKPQRNEPRGASLRSPRPVRTLRTPREHGRSRHAPCKFLANCEEIALPSRVRDGSGLGRRR